MSEKNKTEELVVVDVDRYRKIKNALKDSEIRYRLLFENMSMGVFRIGADGKIVDANPALLKMLGCSSNSELELWQPEKNSQPFLETWGELCDRIDPQGGVSGFDLTWRKKDNTPLFIHVNARVISENDGKVQFYEGTIEDISERKHAENLERALYEIARAPEMAKSLDALYQSVHRIIKGLMPADNFYVALYDEKEDLLRFPYFVDEIDEPPLPRKSGRGLTEYVLRTGRTLLFDATRNEELIRRGEVTRVGVPSSCWLGVPLKAGNRIIGIIAIQHYSDPKTYGEREMQILEYVSGQVASTIEHKRAEEELRQSKVQLQVILESTADGILAIDHKGKVIKVNQRFAQLWRIPPELLDTGDDDSLLNYVLDQLVNPEAFLSRVRLLYQSSAEDSDILAFKDGRIFERFSAPLFLSDSSIGRVWSFRDVSERKRAEERIHAALKEKEVLLQEIHHRVKNNLMSIIGLIQMQEIKAKNEALSTLLRELEGRVRAMALVHENLHKSENLAHIDLQDYIETMVVQIRDQFGAEQNIRFRVQATGVDVGLDIAIPCGLILNELITNAFKYAFPGGRPRSGMSNCEIAVTVSHDDKLLTIEVADNGAGLPAGLDWEQAETLGLRLIKMLSQQLKGFMEIEQASGTVFRLRFPKPAYSEG